MELSHEPDAKYWSWIDAKQIIGPKWPNKYLIDWKLVVFQIIIDLSFEQLAILLFDNSTSEYTLFVCPVKVRLIFHTLRVKSSAAETK